MRIVLLFIALASTFVLMICSRNPKPARDATAVPLSEPSSAPAESGFQCSGKTRCHEMSSCEEALFYLNNCPGVEIDGDGDGRPCEERCGH